MKEKKGLNKFLRLEAIIPIVAVITIFVLYFTFFFDHHVRRGLEWGLTRALGAEVNIGEFNTSFRNLSLRVAAIQITDSNRPNQNVIQVGEIRFGALWDAILRAKLVVNEAVVEQIEFGTPRKSPGWVAPPEPVEQGPGLVDELKDKALNKVQDKYENNVLGDAASWLGDPNRDPLEGIKADVASKAMIESFQKEIETKKTEWDSRLKSLPRPEEFKELGDRIGKVKTSGFKNPAEVVKSVQELEKLIKEADQKYKTLDSANKDLSADLKKIDSEVKTIQKQVQQDIDDLEKRLKIPKLDAQSLATALFTSYLDPYKEKFFHYKRLADKYMPPNLKKKGSEEPDVSLQPRPRSQGVSYEFGRPRSYPMVWIKKTRVSSKAGTSPYSGNIEGEIRHISTNQLLTGEPIVAELRGNFPNAQLQGLYTLLQLDNRKADSVVDFKFSLESYPVATPKTLVKSPDLSLDLVKSNGRMNFEAQITALKDYAFQLRSGLMNFVFETGAKQPLIKQIVDNALRTVPEITISAKAQSTFPLFPVQIDSNLGRELGKAFEAELRAQVQKAKAALQAKVESEIAKNREALEKQINDLKGRVQGEIDKLKGQAENQKNMAEKQIKSAQKDGENKARKSLEKDAKKALKKLFK
ncbi:MAG: TIGR03545 family protein [Bdellovibrionales bacterium]